MPEFTITQTEVFRITAKTPHEAYEQFIGADDNGQWFEGVTEREMTDEDGNSVDYEESNYE